jgi:hypothetical protein
MHMSRMPALVLAVATCVPAPLLAQRLPFDRSFELTEPSILDVSTIRGKIEVIVGEPGRIVVAGAVTIRAAWDVPANAPELARRVVDHPPIEINGNTVRLRPPSDAAERRAVTVSYQVQVPPDTQVLAVSESGATTITGVSEAVTVRTQSGAIELTHLGATAGVTTGSGSVTVDGVAGALTVTTSSSAFTGRSLRGGLRVRTASGTVDATLVGTGDADLETGSSAIRLRGVRGVLKAVTQSGRIVIQGLPAAAWNVSTGSSSIDIAVERGTPFTVEAISGSGSASIVGAAVQGSASKRKVAGTIGGGGPLVRVSSRSGAVRVTVASGANSSRLAPIAARHRSDREAAAIVRAQTSRVLPFHGPLQRL